MKADPECSVCLFRQALNTARAVSQQPALHRTFRILMADPGKSWVSSRGAGSHVRYSFCIPPL